VKLRLRASDKGSLNNRRPYTGRATTARIHGPKGCRVTVENYRVDNCSSVRFGE
jgi:hypothetical protein